MPDFKFVGQEQKQDAEQIRASLTYWKDAWRRLKKNKPAMLGLIGVVIIMLVGIFGPLFSPYEYSDQELDYASIPPRLDVTEIAPGEYVFLSRDYKMLLIDADGNILTRLENVKKDVFAKVYTYDYNGNGDDDEGDIFLDFSYKTDPAKADLGIPFTITFEGTVHEGTSETISNNTYVWGTDTLGRDILTRVMFGARISLTVAVVATIVNLLIGVTYGSISGYFGGKVDNYMMRVVDIINSIPLLLIVILLMVVLGSGGLGTIILALALVYWVGMARLVRGQVLGLKEQEFVLAARTIGVPTHKIIFRHLIPNAIGPIIVSMTMMIPSAVFTEAFLSFIGLGVSAPQASWGTLANDALGGLTSYPYMLFFPSAAIALTMLSFNFLGDGLRDALDPRLRKG